MFTNQHPYLFIYLLGSSLVILLTLFKIAIFYIIDWIIKANILNKNLKKLTKPDNTEWYLKVLRFFGLLLFEAALSWINVVVVTGQILYHTLKVLREIFTPAPEEIKKLRFPLRNNPMLSAEAVWAYLMALNIKSGEALQNESVLFASLEEVLDNKHDFNFQNALDQLGNLNVLNSETITSAKNYYATKNGASVNGVGPN